MLKNLGKKKVSQTYGQPICKMILQMFAYNCMISHNTSFFLHAVCWDGNILIASSSWQVAVPASAEASTCARSDIQLQV